MASVFKRHANRAIDPFTIDILVDDDLIGCAGPDNTLARP